MFQLKNYKSFSTVILIALTCNSAFGESAVYLSKGSPSPFDGMLFTIPKAQELRQNEIELKTYKLLNESLKKSLSEQENIILNEKQKNTLLVERNDELAKDLKDARQTSDFTKAMWFILGMAAVGLGGFAVLKISNK